MSATLIVTVLQLPEAAGGTYDQTLAAALDDVTVAVTQAASHPQSLSATLDGVTVAVSQTARHPQSLAATLDGVAVAVSQGAGHPQSLAAALDSVAVAITQSKVSTYSQSLSAALDDVVASVSQGAQHPQTVAATLDDVSVGISQGVERAVQQSDSGGHYAPSGVTDEDRKKHRQSRREALGMFSKPVQKAVIATVKKVVASPQPEAPVLRRELEKRDVEWKPAYLETVKRLALAVERQQVELKARAHQKRQRDDEEALLMLI